MEMRGEGTKGTRGGGDREEMEVTRLWWRGQQRGHGDDSGDRDKMGPGHGAGDMERTWRWWWGHGHGGGNQQEMVKVTADRGGDQDMVVAHVEGTGRRWRKMEMEMSSVMCRGWWGHGEDVKGGIWRCSR